ncbi:cytochrome c6 PetJ [Stenomitos frigidus]|uniref:cytochrome c6 PetJ n=1 Tax=Stenomitos frigidus TaxID=1886765 RepID=UPI003BB6E9B8
MLIALLMIGLFMGLAGSPAQAGNSANGAKLFNANCAACHMGGNNVILAKKTLKKEALEQYGMASIDAIKNQVTKGKNAMPSFRGRLNSLQIEDVATYVLEQSQMGW